jgi:hypothetical protein
MIIRLGNTLAKKIKETGLASSLYDLNPFADWTARLFTADRTQYILISNTASLYSVVIYGRSITDFDHLIHRFMDMLREVMEKDGFRLIYEKQVAPQAARISFAKSLNRSVTGSMNELIFQAKLQLVEDDLSPYDVSFRLNDTPMSYLKYGNPREAFPLMIQKK